MMRFLFLLLLNLLIVAACSTPANDLPATSTPPPSPDPAERLVIWHHQEALHQALTEQLDVFHRHYPNIRTDLMLLPPESFREEIINAVIGGVAPDLVLGTMADLSALSQGGNLTPLDATRLSALNEFTLLNAVTSAQRQDHLLGYPVLLETSVLYVNRALVGSSIDTFDDLRAAVEQYGGLAEPSLMRTGAWLRNTSPSPVTILGGKLELDRAEVTAYFERLLQLQEAGMIFASNPDPFLNAEVGVYVGSALELPSLQTALGDSLWVEPLRLAERSNAFRFTDAHVLMLTADATFGSIEAGHLLIGFLASPEGQIAFAEAGFAPMRYGFAADDEVLQSITVQLETGKWLTIDPVFYTETLQPFETTIQQLLNGERLPEDAAAQVTS